MKKSWKLIPKILNGTKKIKPFSIHKSGFGTPTAWIWVESVNKIKNVSVYWFTVKV